jgi:hypothetical protein
VLWFGVYHGHLVEFEVPFDQGDCSSTYWAVSNNADIINVAVKGIAFHLLFKVIILLMKNKRLLKPHLLTHRNFTSKPPLNLAISRSAFVCL